MGPRSAKLSQPGVAGCYPRARLFDRLDAARDRPAIWVTGPAGSGKTTLAASYVADRNLPCLWYTLDGGDGDPATWFSYLGMAARELAEGPLDLPSLTPEYLPGLPAFTRNFFETLCAEVPAPALLVFDDYQEVPADSPVHALLAEALTRVPEEVTMVVLSREPPPPTLARMLANRRIATLDGEALRLTADEAAGVASRVLEGEASGVPDGLHEMADGWVAGLVLLLQRAGGGHPRAQDLSRMDRTVLFDYMAGEVFEREPEAVRDLLLSTADPLQFSETTAVALSGRADAGETLARLARSGYFTYRSSTDPPAYRYHPLLREFLRDRADRTHTPEARNARRRAAAAALAAEGQVDDAARLAVEAGDTEALAGLVLEHAPEMAMAGRYTVLEGWLKALPRQAVDGNPWLNYWTGICRLPFVPEESRPHFERAYTLSEAVDDPVGMWLAVGGVAESFSYAYDTFQDFDPWIERMDLLADGFPELLDTDAVRRSVGTALGSLIWRRPDHPNMDAWERRVMSAVDAAADPATRVASALPLMHLYAWRGQFAEMDRLAARLGPLVEAGRVPPVLQVMWWLFDSIFGWGTADFARCEEAMAKGIRIAERFGMLAHPYLLYSQGAYGAMGAWDLERFDRYLERIRGPAMSGGRHLVRSQVMNMCAWRALTGGDVQGAVTYADEAYALTLAGGTPFPQSITQVGLADALWQAGDGERARQCVARARAIAAGMRSHHQLFSLGLVAAHGLWMAGDREEALAELATAFSIGRNHNYISYFWWRPQVMSRLCALALEHGIEPEYTRRLIRERGVLPEKPPLMEDGWEWRVAVRTLGDFEVKVNGETLRFSGKAQKRPLELLKALVAMGDGGKPVAVEHLTDALWPDAEGDSANQAFRAALSRLRKLVGADAVTTADGRVRLDPRLCWVDAWALQRASREGTDLPPKAVTALYRGPFLPEDDHAWLVGRRGALRDAFRREVCQIGKRLCAAADLDRLVTLLEAALDADPHWQEGCRELMATHAARGDLEGAKAAYRRCADALREAREVPAQATEALHHALAVGEGLGPPFR